MKWLKGFVAAFVGGATSAVSLVTADPSKMQDLKTLAGVALAGGITTAVAYMMKSPSETK